MRLGKRQAAPALEELFGIWTQKEACEASRWTYLSFPAPQPWPRLPQWERTASRCSRCSRCSQGIFSLQVQKRVKRQPCDFLTEEPQLSTGAGGSVQFPCASLHFRVEPFFCTSVSLLP